MATVEVLESTEREDLVLITTDKENGLDNIHVTSGEIVEKTSKTLKIRLRVNDAISVGGEIFLWWNRDRKCFIRQ